MSEKFELLGLDDAISTGQQIFNHPTFQAQELIEALKSDISNRGKPQRALALGEFECRVLSATTKQMGWVKGKLKLQMTLEFYPDEPEVSASLESNDLLDEFR